MDVFDYIASNEPRKANQVIMNYGYRVNSPNLAQSLRDLVNYEGEDAMHDLMLVHPDHEYFLSVKSNKNLTKKKDNFSKNFAYLNAIGVIRIKIKIHTQYQHKQTFLYLLALCYLRQP